MPTGFQQQDQRLTSCFTKSAQSPQHGQKADAKTAKIQEKRSFQPRPAH